MKIQKVRKLKPQVTWNMNKSFHMKSCTRIISQFQMFCCCLMLRCIRVCLFVCLFICLFVFTKKTHKKSSLPRLQLCGFYRTAASSLHCLQIRKCLQLLSEENLVSPNVHFCWRRTEPGVNVNIRHGGYEVFTLTAAASCDLLTNRCSSCPCLQSHSREKCFWSKIPKKGKLWSLKTNVFLQPKTRSV